MGEGHGDGVGWDVIPIGNNGRDVECKELLMEDAWEDMGLWCCSGTDGKGR